MAKTFLTNINLKGNQLLNAVIHSAASAPTAYAAGQVYFNTGDNLLYTATAPGTNNWVALGDRYITSVADGLKVTANELSLDLASNLKIDGTGKLSIDRSVTDNWYDASGAAANAQSAAESYADNVASQAQSAAQSYADNVASQAQSAAELYADGVLQTDLTTFEGYADNVAAQAQSTAESYADNVASQAVSTAESYADNVASQAQSAAELYADGLAINYDASGAAANAQSAAESYADNVASQAQSAAELYADGLAINYDASGAAANAQSAAESYADNVASQAVSTAESYADNVASQAQSSAQSYADNVASQAQSTAESYADNVASQAQSTAESYADNVASQAQSAAELYADGLITDLNLGGNAAGDVVTTDGTQTLTNKTFSDSLHFQVPTFDYSAIYANNNNLKIDGSNDITLTTNTGNIILNANQNAYLVSVSTGNKIATISDITASQQGLAVLQSVVAASDSNINLASPIITTIGGVELNDGNRVLVKAQDDATENGIYVFDNATSKLVLSTNPADVVTVGAYTLVALGTYATQGWIVTQYVAGASTWTQFSAAGEYTAGSGISISNNEISVYRSTTDGWYDASGAAANAQSAAESYADNVASQAVSTAESYADNVASQAQSTAESYADNVASQAQSTAESYADNVASQAQSTAESYADNVASQAQSAAELYTDGLGFAGGKFVGTITGGTTSNPAVFNHNFSTRDVAVRVYQTSAGDDQWLDVEVDIKRTSADQVTIGFATTPVTGENYKVVIVG